MFNVASIIVTNWKNDISAIKVTSLQKGKYLCLLYIKSRMNPATIIQPNILASFILCFLVLIEREGTSKSHHAIDLTDVNLDVSKQCPSQDNWNTKNVQKINETHILYPQNP